MYFTKIGITATGIVEISYEQGGETLDRVKLQCSDPPLGSLESALQALREDAASICDEEGFDREMLVVRSLTIKDHPKLGRGVSITAVKTLTNGLNLTLTSPMLYEAGRANALPKRTGSRVAALEKEATKYVQGERLQGRLGLT